MTIKKIKYNCRGLLLSDYSNFICFLDILRDKIHSMYKLHIDDMDCKYSKKLNTIRFSFLIHNKDSLERIDLNIMKGYSSNLSIIDNTIAKKDRYYCNFTLKIDEIDDTIIKLKNLKISKLGIIKYNL